ncbi:LysR family transcriptional regulator [Sphaerisporangium flaviroseum]|uniref:LysR family transcriptional regulator n=1 Tax=Sphaerisporangium flaviroseum TaxID=509199 RepID=A0ABP7HNP9_9ACTN
MSSWSRIELRYLSALAAVARERSFSRAAETLGYTQSAVSQQIARLERIVGQQLVERPGGPRPVSLTAAGELLARHAESIVARLASAAADIDALAEGRSGVLRVGCFQSVGVRILPKVLRRFSAAWPQVEVRLTELPDDGGLLAQVEHGDLDLTFMTFPLVPGPFEAVELLDDPYVLVMRAGSEPAGRSSPLPLQLLTGLPLMTYSPLREANLVENRLGRPDLRDQIVFRSNDNGTLLGLAAEGVGAALMPSLSVDPERPGISVLDLDGVPPRVVGVAWHRDRYRIPAADAFVGFCHAVAAEERHARTPAGGSRPPHA